MSNMIPFGLHIPKCAGTTLLDKFVTVHGDSVYQNTSIAKNFKFNRQDLTDFKGVWPFKFYYGHHLHSEMLKNICGTPFLFTILRDPLDRAVSHFRYQNRLRKGVGKPEISVESFAENMQSMSDFICSRFKDFIDPKLTDASRCEQAWSVLEKFDHIGFMDSLPETSRTLGSVTGKVYDFSMKRNGSPAMTVEEVSLRDQMRFYLKDDIILYYYCKSLRVSDNYNTSEYVKSYCSEKFDSSKFFRLYAHAIFSEFNSLNRLDELALINFKSDVVNEVVKSRLARVSDK